MRRVSWFKAIKPEKERRKETKVLTSLSLHATIRV
jgi:hypothetical protein